MNNFLDCSCSDFLDEYDREICEWDGDPFPGSAWCYVNSPSSCEDLVNSTIIAEKQLSAEACKDLNSGKVFSMSSIFTLQNVMY